MSDNKNKIIMNIFSSSFSRPNTRSEDRYCLTDYSFRKLNSLKNPYHITFFNNSLAKKYFKSKTKNISKEFTTRTPNSKLPPSSKVKDYCLKSLSKSTTPRGRSIIKNTKKIPKLSREDKISSVDKKKTTPYLNIKVVHPQVHVQTTRRNIPMVNKYFNKENTITGITVKTLPQRNFTNYKERKDNIMTANNLTEDVRLKMIQKNNKSSANTSNFHENNNLYNPLTVDQNKTIGKNQYNEPNGQIIQTNSIVTINNKERPTINIRFEPRKHPYQSHILLKYNPKNQYRDLIGLYMISED